MGLKEYNLIQSIEKNLITFEECIEFITKHEGVSSEIANEWLQGKDFLFNICSDFYRLKDDVGYKPIYNFADYVKTDVHNVEFIKNFSNKNITEYAFIRFYFFLKLSNEFQLSAQTRYLCFNIYHNLVEPQWLETKNITLFNEEFSAQDYYKIDFDKYNPPEPITENEAICLLLGVQPTHKNFYTLESGNLWVSQNEFNSLFDLIGFSHYGIKYNDHQFECEMNDHEPFFREIDLKKCFKYIAENETDWSFLKIFEKISLKEKNEKPPETKNQSNDSFGNACFTQTDPIDLETQIRRLLTENSLLKSQLEGTQTVNDEISNPNQRSTVAKMIGKLILKAFPNATKDNGLCSHGLIEIVKNETGVTQTTAKTWIELAQEKLQK